MNAIINNYYSDDSGPQKLLTSILFKYTVHEYYKGHTRQLKIVKYICNF